MIFNGNCFEKRKVVIFLNYRVTPVIVILLFLVNLIINNILFRLRCFLKRNTNVKILNLINAWGFFVYDRCDLKSDTFSSELKIVRLNK